MEFRSCFSRKGTFEWFVVIVCGLLIRRDHLGVTSVIRGMGLIPKYVGLINFFRSSAWVLDILNAKWCSVIKKVAPLVKCQGAVILVGDGIKYAKEGRRMPGVKRHHQESGNLSKPEYMWGHLFGGIGILGQAASKYFCLPLALRLQDGVKTIFGWDKTPQRQESHVVEMIRLAYKMAGHFDKGILLLDRLFLSVPALETLDMLGANNPILHIVTKAKCNSVAYREFQATPGKRGRPRKKGASVKMIDLFETAQFQYAEICLYGKPAQVKYHCVDLLWGQKLYKKLRFVLVEYNGAKVILVSTDLTLPPLDIIDLYSKRFSIETMFREMNQVICAFGYRFWSKYMPKLDRFRKKTDPDPLDSVSDHARQKIRLAVKAIEGFVFCAIVATGLLQITSMKFSNTDELANLRYLRTRRNIIASEATIADFLQNNFFRLLLKCPNLDLTRIISSKQTGPPETPNLKRVS